MTGQNEHEPLVSVIINCYNGAEFLKEAINSVYLQTYTNWEIIFWDNQSVDESAKIAISYGKKVKYFLAPKNTPLGEARNLAIEKATGKYIAFVDCDDIWYPEKLKLQVQLMEENPDYILCYGSIEEVAPNREKLRTVYTIHESGFLFSELLFQYDVNILTSIINRQLLEESGLSFDPNITASEEYCLFMQLACLYKIGVLDQVLAQYRVYASSLTSRSLGKLGFERRYTLNRILERHPELKAKHKHGFKEAFARANYYDARWYMSNKQQGSAFKSMFKIVLADKRYFILTLLTILPKPIWDFIHLRFQNRS